MSGQVDGKVAVVTGGASGLGRATVERLCEEGARVVVADVDDDRGHELAHALGDACAFRRTDVADADAIQGLVDFTVDHFGALDVMVNNAGVGQALGGFLQDDLADFSRIIGVNLYGVMVGSQRAARHKAEHGGGSIVNNSSIGGVSPGSGVQTYRASKAAVNHFSRSIAVELAPRRVRVNCVAPGHIATDITHYDMSSVIRLTQPLPRQGTPADFAEAVLFLASDRSAQITGVVLPVDGGTTAGPPPGLMREVMKR
jgi:NAD(P)-dependent dehydrogenase (short-subunit alcohol dehydrogenase family)